MKRAFNATCERLREVNVLIGGATDHKNHGSDHGSDHRSGEHKIKKGADPGSFA